MTRMIHFKADIVVLTAWPLLLSSSGCQPGSATGGKGVEVIGTPSRATVPRLFAILTGHWRYTNRL